MIFFLSLFSWLIFGCQQSNPLVRNEVDRSVGGSTKSQLLAAQLEASIGTCGSFETDYKDASMFIDTLSDTREFPVKPVEYLLEGYDLTVMQARDVGRTQRPLMSTKIPQYLIFCRLMRNAFHTESELCQQQLVRDAMFAMSTFQPPVPRKRAIMDTFKLLSDQCESRWEHLPKTTCREHSLRSVLALYVIEISRPNQPNHIQSVIAWVKESISTVDIDSRRCKNAVIRHKYDEYLRKITTELSSVLDTSLVCHDEQIAIVMERIKKLDTELRPNLPC